MVQLEELVDYVDRLLDSASFADGCPNGLQVEGRPVVRRLMSGVTASMALLELALEFGADAVLVHHGYFWKGEGAAITGMKRHRIALLLQAEMSLLAWHLPLDAHPELGNNAQLARLLGLRPRGGLGGTPALAMTGVPEEPLSAQQLAERIESRLGRRPLHIASGPELISNVAWCSGAAHGYLEEAARSGMDAYITGEICEPAVHVARECRIHLFAAGHHATERYGVRALGEHLAQHFGLEHRFADIDNPV